MTDSKARIGYLLRDDERCLTASEMAELAAVKVKTIYESCSEGLIPGAFKTRRLWRVTMGNFRKFLQMGSDQGQQG